MSALSDDLPVISTDDVLKEFPREVRASQNAPIRDAIVASETALFLEYQPRAEYAAAQSDILRATGIYLEGLGEDRGFKRQRGETDEAYRERIISTPGLVTPEAIVDIVNIILSAYTVYKCRYFERALDCTFLSDGTAPWHSFPGASPFYPDRIYDSLPKRDPGGYWVFDGKLLGRYFILRIPQIATSADAESSFLATGQYGSFISTGTGNSRSFLFDDRLTSEDIYSLIITTVNSIKGQSMRWKLYVDPTLTY